MFHNTLTKEDAAIVHAAGLRSTRHRAVEVIRMMRDDNTDYRAMQREMVSRYDWHDGETHRERNARILRAAGEPL